MTGNGGLGARGRTGWWPGNVSRPIEDGPGNCPLCPWTLHREALGEVAWWLKYVHAGCREHGGLSTGEA